MAPRLLFIGKLVTTISKGDQFAESIWRNLRFFLQYVFPGKARSQAYEGIEKDIANLFSEKAFSAIQKCLRDMEGRGPHVSIAVEPLDTPDSPLETESGRTAEYMTAGLLNTFLSNFAPSPSQKLDVYLGIPWHRYNIDHIVYPQRIRQYELKLKWNLAELGDFIDKRIKWEFQNVGRHVKKAKPAWFELFSNCVTNLNCGADEDSFMYVVRHTHHRPRDLQRIAKEAVELCARETNRTIQDVLRGKGVKQVDGEYIRVAVAEYCRSYTDDYWQEVTRRFPEIQFCREALRGLSVPCAQKDLMGRLEKGPRKKEFLEIGKLIRKLWESGVIGLEVVATTDVRRKELEGILPDEAQIADWCATRKRLNRWYFFSYNTSSGPEELVQQLETENTNVSYIPGVSGFLGGWRRG